MQSKLAGKKSIFDMDLVIVPLHLDVHWCVAVINMKDKVIEFYDSLNGDPRDIFEV